MLGWELGCLRHVFFELSQLIDYWTNILVLVHLPFERSVQVIGGYLEALSVLELVYLFLWKQRQAVDTSGKLLLRNSQILKADDFLQRCSIPSFNLEALIIPFLINCPINLFQLLIEGNKKWVTILESFQNSKFETGFIFALLIEEWIAFFFNYSWKRWQWFNCLLSCKVSLTFNCLCCFLEQILYGIVLLLSSLRFRLLWLVSRIVVHI